MTTEGTTKEGVTSANYITGLQGGLTKADQLKIALEVMVKNGGVATLDQIYAAVEVKLDGPKLSEEGKTNLKNLLRQFAVEKGLVETLGPGEINWRVTQLGQQYLSMPPSSGQALFNELDLEKIQPEEAQLKPDSTLSSGQVDQKLKNFQENLHSNNKLVRQAIWEYPAWLLQTFPDKVKLSSDSRYARLDVFFYDIWVQSCWFNKVRGVFVHTKDTGSESIRSL